MKRRSQRGASVEVSATSPSFNERKQNSTHARTTFTLELEIQTGLHMTFYKCCIYGYLSLNVVPNLYDGGAVKSNNIERHWVSGLHYAGIFLLCSLRFGTT